MIVYVNGQARTVPPASTLSGVLDRTVEGDAPPRGIAVALDGAVVPRGEVARTVLHEGARVEIVTAVQGG